MKTVDLFSGTGAFSLAFGGNDVVFANDFCLESKTIYDQNFNHKLTLKDINEINVEDIPKHDILTAGFPCQPFSIAGERQGFKDPRSNVFWKLLEIIDHCNPGIIVLENVKNLVSHDSSKTFKTIITNLESRKYHVQTKVLDTAQITGIPHHRERIYIVCFKSKEHFDKFDLNFPNVPKKPITSFLEKEIPEKYYYTPKSKIYNKLCENVTQKGVVYQYRRTYVRENKSGECPTLTCNMGTGGNNCPIILDDKGIRKLTPRECFNLQGFPLRYKISGLSDSNLYKLVGNSVSLGVIKMIAQRILNIF
jgi:DNA (cytosine-5)-methyltransferase 1